MVNKFPPFQDIYKKVCEHPRSGNFRAIIIDAVQEIDDSISEDIIDEYIMYLESYFKRQDDDVIEFNDTEDFVIVKEQTGYQNFVKTIDLLTSQSFAALCCDLLNKNSNIRVYEVAPNSTEDSNTIDIKGYLEEETLGTISIYSQVKCSNKNIGLNQLKQFVGGVIKNIADENKTIVHPYILTYFVKNGYDERATEFSSKTGIKCYTTKNIYDFCSKYGIDIETYL